MSENQNENIIVLQDENGQDVEFGILFTYHNEETNIDYVVIYPMDELEDENEELSLFAYRYKVNEEGVGDLEPIENDDEFKMIDEVINQYYDDLDSTND